MKPSPERELAAVAFVESDMLLTDMCRVLHAEPPIPSDVISPARWGWAGDVTQEFLAWAFHNAEARS